MPQRVAVIPLECRGYPLGGGSAGVACGACSGGGGWQSTGSSAELGGAGLGPHVATRGAPPVLAEKARTRGATEGNGVFSLLSRSFFPDFYI